MGTLTWLAHGCFGGADGVCGHVIMVDTLMLCGNGRWLAHGCSVGPDGVCGDVILVGTWMICLDFIMVDTWMLCGNGRSLWARYHGHGWHMDALWERTEFFWTLSGLPHGCAGETDGVCGDVNMVGTWMLCANGQSLSGRYHGWHLDALRKRTEFVWTLSWSAHGCSVVAFGVCGDVNMVGTWVLCGNGGSLWGCYHGWHMGALWQRTEFVGMLAWLAHGFSAVTAGDYYPRPSKSEFVGRARVFMA